MDNTDWQILKYIKSEQNITRVAEKLFLSQPAISYRLNKMQNEFESTLFYRTNKGISLTSAGERLLGFSDIMIHYNQKINDTIKNNHDTISGTIELGTTENFLYSALGKQLHAFHERYPNIVFNVETSSSVALRKKLQENKVMLCTLRGDASLQENSTLLTTEDMYIISSVPITDEVLNTTPFLSNYLNSAIAKPMEHWLTLNNITPLKSNINLKGSSRGIMSLVESGLGWSIISSSHFRHYKNDLYHQKLINQDGSAYTYPTYIAYSDKVKSFDVYNLYIDHLNEYFQ